jgi:hypothetical protein
VGASCSRPDGGVLTLTSPPLPETGAALQTPGSGSSFGAGVQLGAQHTNFGILGESTPSAGAALQRGSSHLNIGGLRSAAEPH